MNKSFIVPGYGVIVVLACLIGFAPLVCTDNLAAQTNPIKTNYPLPEQLTFCGERVPLEDQYVREMLDREFTISVWDNAQVFMWWKRAGRYFPHIESALAEAGLPEDLKYLAVAESALIADIRSGVGARGLWQFMSATGKRYGLKHTGALDERRNFEQATAAAIKYLTKLYGQFGSWTLALAGYNCGEQCVENAMNRQKVRDYYHLNLPKETERFVFRILAIKIILDNPEQYGFRIQPDHIYPPIAADVRNVNLRYSLHITDVARELGTDYKTIKELNLHILGKYLPAGSFVLNVPAGKGAILNEALNKLSRIAATKPKPRPAKKSNSKYYRVRSGDTLSRVSARTGVSISRLKSLNGLRSDVIWVGQKLRTR